MTGRCGYSAARLVVLQKHFAPRPSHTARLLVTGSNTAAGADDAACTTPQVRWDRRRATGPAALSRSSFPEEILAVIYKMKIGGKSCCGKVKYFCGTVLPKTAGNITCGANKTTPPSSKSNQEGHTFVPSNRAVNWVNVNETAGIVNNRKARRLTSPVSK